MTITNIKLGACLLRACILVILEVLDHSKPKPKPNQTKPNTNQKQQYQQKNNNTTTTPSKNKNKKTPKNKQTKTPQKWQKRILILNLSWLKTPWRNTYSSLVSSTSTGVVAQAYARLIMLKCVKYFLTNQIRTEKAQYLVNKFAFHLKP